ncbi:MAG: hypothetical protein AAB456_00925 [Patescibacteria group bacterium]
MDKHKRFGALSSSTDPSQLAATVQALILAAGTIIIMIAGWLGIVIVDAQITAFATQVGLAVSSLWFLYGVLRKVVVRLFEQK